MTFGVDAKGEPTRTWQSYGSLSTGNTATDNRIGTLHSSLKNQIKSFILKSSKRFDIDLRVTDGFRSVEEQDAKYAQGRTQAQIEAQKKKVGITRTIEARPNEGKVTNAIGGYSNHNFGLAIDVVPLENGRLNWETRNWPMILRQRGTVSELYQIALKEAWYDQANHSQDDKRQISNQISQFNTNTGGL